MSGWSRCPRCGSGAVRVKDSGYGIGCLSYLLGAMYVFMGLMILVAIISGNIINSPLSTLFSILILIGIITLLRKLKSKSSGEKKTELYCKSCEYHFTN